VITVVNATSIHVFSISCVAIISDNSW